VRVNTPRMLTTKIPINKLEDVKGLKIRVPENKMLIALLKSWGAIPTVIPMADVYTGLATGTIDAQENPLPVIWSNKLYEQVKYCAMTEHMREMILMIVNDKWWKGLTAAQKKILTSAMEKSNQLVIDEAAKSTEEYKKMLAKEGMKFTTPNVAPFREKAKTIWNQFGDPELIKKAEAVK
jgi:TRAP-type C4-dicarboxylate transport system substrate-binding protein